MLMLIVAYCLIFRVRLATNTTFSDNIIIICGHIPPGQATGFMLHFSRHFGEEYCVVVLG